MLDDDLDDILALCDGVEQSKGALSKHIKEWAESLSGAVLGSFAWLDMNAEREPRTGDLPADIQLELHHLDVLDTALSAIAAGRAP